MSRVNIKVGRYPGGSPSYTADQLPSYSGGNGTPAWTPSSLYAGDGDWYLATDLTTLFQDSAKTTAVASDSDPIGAWVGRMGVGPDLIQTTGANKPLLYISGGETAVQLPYATDVWLVGALSPSIAYTGEITVWSVTRTVNGNSTQAHLIPCLRSGVNPVLPNTTSLQPEYGAIGTFGRCAVRGPTATTTSGNTGMTQTQYKSAALKIESSGTSATLYTGPTAKAAAVGPSTDSRASITIDTIGTLYGSTNIVALGYIRRAISDAEMALISAWAVSTFGAQF